MKSKTEVKGIQTVSQTGATFFIYLAWNMW